jgi:hypothetical protein
MQPVIFIIPLMKEFCAKEERFLLHHKPNNSVEPVCEPTDGVHLTAALQLFPEFHIQIHTSHPFSVPDLSYQQPYQYHQSTADVAKLKARYTTIMELQDLASFKIDNLTTE